jgi:hypothetical protein
MDHFGASSAPLILHDLLRSPDGMTAVELTDGRRVFAPEGSDPNAVRRQVTEREMTRYDRAGRRESALGLGYTDMRKGLDGLATLVQEHLKKDPFSGHLFAFRGSNASRLKILFWDGNRLCLSARDSIKVASSGPE